MITRKRCLAVVSLAVGLIGCLMGSANAQRGGIYVEELQIKNGGRVAFSDNFDDGSISDWSGLSDVSVFTIEQQPRARMLCMNSHKKAPASAQHALDLTPDGCVELSVAVYVAPAQDQYEWQRERFASFFVAMEYREKPSSPADMMRIDVILYPKDLGCKVGAKRNSPVVDKYNATAKPIMPTGNWALLTLRLDPESQTATVSVDNTPVASVPYDPAAFPKFTNLVLSTSFGDGSQRTD